MDEITTLSVGFDAAILAGLVSQSSREMYQRDFLAYLAFAENREQALLSPTLARWRTHLSHATTKSPNTINRMLTSVKTIMDAAAEQGLITHDEYDAFKRVRGVKLGALIDRTRVNNRVKIEPETIRAIMTSFDTTTLVGLRNKALFLTLASSGLRVTELITLTRKQISKRNQGYLITIFATLGKNQTENREAHITAEAVQAIDEWIAARPIPTDYIFTSFQVKGGGKPIANHLSHVGTWKIVKAVFHAHSIENVKPHDRRRFVGTQLAKTDIRKAQKALGHKRIETTGKLAECWDANTGLRASCPNLQPKNDGPKVRHDFQFLAYCVEYTSFFKQKMHDRFRLLAMKLPLQKRSEAKKILLVPTLSPKSDHRA